jgi:hypothetical protein
LPTPPRDFSIREPDILDETMTRGDLVFMLENLHFGRDDLGRLQIDRGVRDYLLGALRARPPLKRGEAGQAAK